MWQTLLQLYIQNSYILCPRYPITAVVVDRSANQNQENYNEQPIKDSEWKTFKQGCVLNEIAKLKFCYGFLVGFLFINSILFPITKISFVLK